MRCTHTIDKNTALWSKWDIQEVGQGHEDRACNTNDLQTLVYFTGSYVQLPSKSPVLPLGVIVPGWLGDRCQVAPPQPIHHAKQRGKADLSLSPVFVFFACLFFFANPHITTLSWPRSAGVTTCDLCLITMFWKHNRSWSVTWFMLQNNYEYYVTSLHTTDKDWN